MEKRRFISGLAFFIAVLASTISCEETDTYPVTPYIEFKDFFKIPTTTGIDDKGVLVISFTDGDADIGLKDEDTLPPYDANSEYYYNFFVTYFEKQNGVFKEVQLPLTFNARIPYVNPTGSSKGIKGEIEIELFINNTFSDYDTIRFDAYIVDRALHKSNIIQTPEIIIDKK